MSWLGGDDTNPTWDKTKRAVLVTVWTTRLAWTLTAVAMLAAVYAMATGHHGRAAVLAVCAFALHLVARWEPPVISDFRFEDEERP